MKNRRSWLVIAGVALALGGCTVYYALLHDWRGSFTAEQLRLEAHVSENTLTLTLVNAGPGNLMIRDSPALASPFEIVLEAGDGQTVRAVPGDQRLDRSRVLPRNAQCAWRVPLRVLFPGASPGDYTLRAAYDPAAAAGRGEPCAAEINLGRVEAEPLAIRLSAGR